YVVTQKTGEPPDDPTLLDNLPAGNILFGNGIFVAAGRTHLDVYVPLGVRLPVGARSPGYAPTGRDRQRGALHSAEATQTTGRARTARRAGEVGRSPPSKPLALSLPLFRTWHAELPAEG